MPEPLIQNPLIDPDTDWSTPLSSVHAARVILDSFHISWDDKDLICAVIMGESEFDNTAKNENKRKDGTVSSTDWGLAQINDRYHIGLDKDFTSVTYLLDHPDEAVRFMCRMFKAGKLNLWCAYSNNSYLKFRNGKYLEILKGRIS